MSDDYVDTPAYVHREPHDLMVVYVVRSYQDVWGIHATADGALKQLAEDDPHGDYQAQVAPYTLGIGWGIRTREA